MRAFAFSLRMFLSEDKKYISLLDALEKLAEEIDEDCVAKLEKSVDEGGGGFDDIADLNSQLYMVLCDAAVPRSPAHNKLMALERRVTVRGLYAYWDFNRDLTGTNETSKQLVAKRIRSPPVATDIEDLDVRLIQWEEDLKRHEAFESMPDELGKTVTLKISDSMKASTVKKMLPPDLVKLVKLHNPKGYMALKALIREEIREHKERKLMGKDKGLAPSQPGAPEIPPADGGFVDEPLSVWDYELNSFVPKGQGKERPK